MNAVLICNPNAGRRIASDGVGAAVDVLRDAGWTVSVHLTAGAGDATRLAQEAVDAGVEAVLVAGGDGTLNEAVQAVAGTDTALGYLPFGTVNIWARELGVPLHGAGAARAIAGGRIEQVDLGTVNGRYFLLMAGAGFDSEVVRRARTLERHKGRFGVLPYVAAGLTTLPVYRGADFELRYDGVIRRVQALMLVVGNTRLYGGRFYFTPGAVANDGLLDVCVIKGHGSLAMVRQSLPLLVSGTVRLADVELLRVRNLTVTADIPMAIQTDGELAESLPATFGVAPRALRVIVPADFASDLIA